jgi:UDPglucose--hexose-1-phosphate uridylyltransferase
VTERRFDPTTGEWITIATQRQHRTYKPAAVCPLCPTRPGEEPTEMPYPSFQVVTFDNLFPSFSPDPPAPEIEPTQLYQVAPAIGRCEVVVYSDDHDTTFSELSLRRVRMLVDIWADRTAILGADPAIAYVMPFENKGETVGTTLHHPHGQIYGYPEIPPRPRRELEAAEAHFERTSRCVHCDVVAAELADERRVVDTNDGWVAWVPFSPRFPYEVRLASTAHRRSLPELDDDERDALASLMLSVAQTYDRLWGFSLPYVMAFHQQPCDGDERWGRLSHLHAEFTPLHRAPDRLKYLAGSELAGGAFVTDVAPETAAAELRAARPKHASPSS